VAPEMVVSRERLVSGWVGGAALRGKRGWHGECSNVPPPWSGDFGYLPDELAAVTEGAPPSNAVWGRGAGCDR
jgi:hypothetical protein